MSNNDKHQVGRELLSDLHWKVIQELDRCPKTPSGIIKFHYIYLTTSLILHLTKKDTRTIIRYLVEAGVAELVPYHGIRLKTCANEERDDKKESSSNRI